MPPKRRRKYHGLYFHSSPPKILPMNGNSNQSGNTIRNGREDGGKEVFVVKPSNIRIWIHDKDVGKLTRVLWAGQGNRLRTEVSSNPRVRKFLENVPYVLNVIKDVHQAVIDNNLELVQQKIEPPVPANLITTKDANGLTVMHKAAGLAYTMIVEYLLNIWPDGAVEIDSTGKTPLHWAASAKNNARCYNLLVQAGADEEALDYKMKTPSYYKQKPNDIDRTLLTMLPDAPRISQENQPDWSVLVDEGAQIVNTDAMTINPPDSRRGSDVLGNGMNLLTTRSRANSIEQTSEPEVEDDDGGEKLTIEEAALRAAIEEETNETNENAPLTNGDVANGNDVFSGGGGSPTPHLRDYVNPNLKSDDLSANGNEDNEEKQNGNDEEPEKQNENEEEPEKEVDTKDLENGSAEDVKGDEINEDNANEDNANEENGNEENGNEAIENDETENDEQPPQTDAESPEETPEQSVVEAIDNTKDDNEENDIEQAEPNNEEETSEQQNNIEENESNEPEETVDLAEDDKNEQNANVDENKDDIEAIINTEDEKSQPEDEKSKPEEEASQPEEEASQPEEETSQPDEETSKPEEEKTSQPQDETSQPNENTVDDDDKTIEQNESSTIETQENHPESNEPPAEDAQPKDNNQSAAEPSTEEKPSTEDDNSSKDNKLETSDETKIDDDENKKNKEEEDDDDQNENETDENHNALKSEKNGWSPSTTLEIEGLVQGDPDDNQVQSESAAYVEEGSANSSSMPTADMEQLAALVLNGEGKKLLGTRSDQPEIQAFLDNVPAYMNKIRRVHQAARDGNLRDLQAALDRRKFAIAKDEITPNGASPLHVATIFGHAGIIRYLGGRFPETTSVVDDNGRTALHYAATINDNGHFYNLLTHLGSNPKAIDKLGNTPDFYRDTEQSEGILSYKQLLKEFGAEESLEQEMLSDQGKPLINNSLEIPLFKTEQGQYLASTLGEPLVKGLTEIVERRPSDPVAYLAAFLQNYIKTRTSQPSTPQIRSATFSQRTPSGGLDSTAIPSKPSPPQREEIPPTPEGYETPSFGEDRDEHGQSMLHFACARSHGRNALLNVIEESEIDITYRDELYRTARDVALQANQPLNAKDIDRFVLVLAAKGDMKAFEDLVAEGYDHILDITDDQSNSIVDVARVRGQYELVSFLEDIQSFEEAREDLHQAIREGNNEKIREIIAANDAARLVRAKNYYGRTALHIAILKENEEMVELFTNVSPAALRAGDNLERTPLHYAMGVNSVETLSRILIRKGAKRTTKDLKGRQPTYYFMNKADILRLQEEEDEDH